MKRAFRPDNEDKPFIARWNMLARVMLIDTSVKMVARAAMDYADFDDGSSCHPSNERIARETGYCDKTVRQAWSALRGIGLAVRVNRGVSYKRLADEYQLTIPQDWLGLPLLGPHGQKFTCRGCGSTFNPAGNCLVGKDDKVTFDLRPMVYCSAPPIRRPAAKSRASSAARKKTCYDLWNEEQRRRGKPTWGDAAGERWKWFYEARNDEW